MNEIQIYVSIRPLSLKEKFNEPFNPKIQQQYFKINFVNVIF